MKSSTFHIHMSTDTAIFPVLRMQSFLGDFTADFLLFVTYNLSTYEP